MELCKCDKCGIVKEKGGLVFPKDWVSMRCEVGRSHPKRTVNIIFCSECYKPLEKRFGKDFDSPTIQRQLIDLLYEIVEEVVDDKVANP